MNHRLIRSFGRPLFAAFLFHALLGAAPFAQADEAEAFFDDSYVHEIRLTFADSNWYNTLYTSHSTDDADPYFPASFSCDGVTIDQIGVRMKGNSSFGISTIKKSLKLDFDEYAEDTDLNFMGIKKLNLNNGYKDPSFLREKLFLDFAAPYIPSIRCVFVRVFVNDVYLGLYTAVEQVDKTFIQDRWGGGEDGNLYKGAASDDLADAPNADFGSDLAWEGSDESSYYDHYQLKTNETENDYSGLVAMIDALNNQDPDTFPTTLEPLMDIDNVLAGLALNSLFSNADAYNGSAHNYYLYQSDSSGQFSHVLWDTNESFGSFSMYYSRGVSATQVHPLWIPTGEDRPLMEYLWENASYQKKYLLLHAKMLREGFDLTSMTARINELADLIRADVYADSYKQYSNTAFETNLTSSYVSGRDAVLGLADFIQARAAYLEGILDGYADQTDFQLNEIVAVNDSTTVDGVGDSDPWIELYNGGVGESNLSGLYLSDTTANKTKWALPSVSVDDGDFFVVWMDGETAEGTDHASFTLASSGGTLFLYDSSGDLIDSITYPALSANHSYQRFPDGDDALSYSDHSTPGAANQISDHPSVVLFLNELMAVNTVTIADPNGLGGYPDWFEIYNPNDYSVDLGGMYLTDDISLPKQWQIPEGVEITAGGHLLFWADNDEEQGATHTNFKLSSGGEEIALFDTDETGNVLIDWVTFGEQTADISYGRSADGSAAFELFSTPTPGATNSVVSVKTFWGFEILLHDGQDWSDSGDWIGWMMVSYRPWAWSLSLTAWLYMDEAYMSANGGWAWLVNDDTISADASGAGTYLGFTVQNVNGGQWIDTGAWVGWLEVSNAPWVYSNSADAWFYCDEAIQTTSGIWIWAVF